ncbi:unnamed protein product [Effrenium voratum]|nr:unnamed protein product [Effrenium voratum]
MEPRAMRDEVPDRAAVEAQLGEWATYGAQLRAWVGLQVDEHVSRVVPGLLDARLLPISEMLNDLRRHVANLQDRSRNWSLDTEMHRLEQRLSSSRFDAVGDLENRTRLSMEALAAEEAQARHQLELRLGQVEAITKVLDETLHAVDSENGRSLQDAFAQLAAKVEVLDETLHAVDSGSNQLSAQVQALDESFRGDGAPSRVEAELRSLSAKVEVLDETFQSQFPSVRTLADKVQVWGRRGRGICVERATSMPEDMESPMNPPGGSFSDPVLCRADSFASTRASTTTSGRGSVKSLAMREHQRKMLVMAFLDANGFMHINEAKTSWGRTCYPLHVAVRQNKPAVVKALLSLGAWRNVKSRRGQTPEELAHRCQHRWGGFEEVLKMFEEEPERKDVPSSSSSSTNSA